MAAELTISALMMAMRYREVGPGLIHHSDQGSQYTDSVYQQILNDWGVQVSMNGVGSWYDNAPMESFIGALKTECVTYQFATRAEARLVIFEYIEVWYNRQRLRSAIGYMAPMDYERQFHPLKSVR